ERNQRHRRYNQACQAPENPPAETTITRITSWLHLRNRLPKPLPPTPRLPARLQLLKPLPPSLRRHVKRRLPKPRREKPRPAKPPPSPPNTAKLRWLQKLPK